jgi:predicted DNA-binding transcriptional regulator AlpA
MNLEGLLTETEYAQMRGVSLRTAKRERALRSGPPFIKWGRAVFYRRAAIDAWILEQETTTPAKKSA